MSKTSGSTRVVFRAQIPAEAVLSLPVFGQNVTEEREVVVNSAPLKTWESWVSTAPAFGEWDPAEHPRNAKGEFIDSPSSAKWYEKSEGIARAVVRAMERREKKKNDPTAEQAPGVTVEPSIVIDMADEEITGPGHWLLQGKKEAEAEKRRAFVKERGAARRKAAQGATKTGADPAGESAQKAGIGPK